VLCAQYTPNFNWNYRMAISFPVPLLSLENRWFLSWTRTPLLCVLLLKFADLHPAGRIWSTAQIYQLPWIMICSQSNTRANNRDNHSSIFWWPHDRILPPIPNVLIGQLNLGVEFLSTDRQPINAAQDRRNCHTLAAISSRTNLSILSTCHLPFLNRTFDLVHMGMNFVYATW
jgi:hypothetical protein